ncbi:MAG: site-2 protease family protein [Bacteroidota bacterium]
MDKNQKTKFIQLGLFVLTVITTTFAGTEWITGKYLFYGMTWDDFVYGFSFSIPFLAILTAHEFGHYFTARYHQVKVTLPYYIPFWLGFLPGPSIGTMGAFIRIKEHISSRTKYFDVGVSGPIAGFVVAIAVLIYGFRTLPPTEFIYEFHPEYEVFGENFEERMEGLDTLILKSSLNPDREGYELLPDTIITNDEDRLSIHFGDNLLMYLGRTYIAPKDRYVPSSKEIMHYPWLLASFLAFFFTALNLLPIGQLDGGHVLFGLFGSKNHSIISRILFTIFLFYAGLGAITLKDLNGLMDGTLDEPFWKLFYLLVTYYASFSVFKETKNRILYLVSIFTAQLVLNMFTGWEGYSGWLVFSLLIGRFIGVDHPPVIENQELSIERKILGWIALIIFILCFSPEPLIVEGGGL